VLVWAYSQGCQSCQATKVTEQPLFTELQSLREPGRGSSSLSHPLLQLRSQRRLYLCSHSSATHVGDRISFLETTELVKPFGKSLALLSHPGPRHNEGSPGAKATAQLMLEAGGYSKAAGWRVFPYPCSMALCSNQAVRGQDMHGKIPS
jgi:hypothetical protein